MCVLGPRNANKSVTCLEELVARCPSLSEEDKELYTFITDRVAGFKAETVDMCKYYYCCCCCYYYYYYYSYSYWFRGICQSRVAGDLRLEKSRSAGTGATPHSEHRFPAPSMS